MAKRTIVPPIGDTPPDIDPTANTPISKETSPEENPDGFIREFDEASIEESAPPPPQRTFRPPNPAIVKNDPMAELFGPGTTIRQIGEESDEMPDEVRCVIEENGLAKRDFTCTLKEIPDGSLTDSLDNSASSRYIQAWKRAIPSTEYIAREHGPGSYILILNWRQIDREENRHVAKREMVPIIISDKCAAEHKKHILTKKINAAAATSQQVREAITESAIEGQLVSAITGKQNEEKKQSPKEYIEELMSTARAIGLPVGGMGAVPVSKIDWEKVLAVAIPGVTALMTVMQQASQRKSDESMKLFMMMLSQNQSASNQMLELVKAQTTKPAADNPLKELQQMVMTAMDIKGMMNPEKETVSDKIFKIVEMVAPQILTIAATAAQNNQPPSGPAVTMAKMYMKADPDFEKLKNDPAEMMKLVNRLDERLGWANADVILETAGWERPAMCMRDPAKQHPPQMSAEDGVIDDPTAQ